MDIGQKNKQSPDSCLSEAIRNAVLKPIDIFHAADQGDLLARDILDIVNYWFYVECTNLIMISNPQKIIIQGLYRNAGQYFMEKLQEFGRDFPTYEDFRSYEISYSTRDERSAEAKGAALFVFQHFFIDGA